MRYMITDEIWTVMGPLVEAHTSPHGPAPKISERMFFEALLYVARTGVPWRDLPGDFGNWSAVYNRFRRWVESDRFKNLFRAMTIAPGCEGLGRVFADSTIVRAHQHSAGARKKKAPAGGEAIGRSRGGLTTKVMVVATDEDSAVVVSLEPGQANDCPLLMPALEEARELVGPIDEVVGDEGFDSDKNRFGCLDNDTAPIIPNRKNRINPWPFDEDERATYKGRNCIERLFAKAKQFRRFATRYEKRKSMFMAVVQLVFGFIRMRKIAT